MRDGLIMFTCIVLTTISLHGNERDEPSAWADEAAKKWEGQIDYTVQLINQMPEDKMDYRPGEGARSFSELFKHIAGSSIFLKAVFEGTDIYEAFGQMQALEKTTLSKGDLTEKIESNMKDLTTLIKNLSDKDLNKTFEFSFLPGKPLVKIKDVINAMGTHFAHHRGQATTYLRLNGITPVGYQNWW